tara:strand:- start:72 stop:995 length:924 start_codon:yes stop_codon:yes gene_type:complete
MESRHKSFNIALVALDLTEMDEYIIQYTAMISKLMPLERILFVHVEKNLELPADLMEKFPDLMAPLDESIKEDIRNKVEKHFQNISVDIDYIVREGNPINKILKLSKVKNVDLIIMGRKQNLKGSGIVSSHIARISPCSLLFVTENYQPEIKKIMVPVDFSSHSLMAVKHGQEVAEKAGAEVCLSHVYNVPAGYTKTGKTLQEFAEIMKKHAQNDCKTFFQKNNLTLESPCEYILNDSGKPADLIYEYGKKVKASLIVVGSKGRTSASAFLIGSIAEKLALKDSDIPILIVKTKGEIMGFLESLMRV